MGIFLFGLVSAFIGAFVTTAAKLIVTRLFEDKKKTTQNASDNVTVVVFVILQ